MDARRFGVGLVGATVIFAAGCWGSSETSADDVQASSPPPAPASADPTASATETATEAEPDAQDEGDGDYSAISGTWTGDLIWTPEGVDGPGTPYHAELQLQPAAEPRTPVGTLVERRRADGEATCTWTVYAVKATAPTYEVSASGGSCDSGAMELELDEASDVLVVDGWWPKGTWRGELTREAAT